MKWMWYNASLNILEYLPLVHLKYGIEHHQKETSPLRKGKGIPSLTDGFFATVSSILGGRKSHPKIPLFPKCEPSICFLLQYMCSMPLWTYLPNCSISWHVYYWYICSFWERYALFNLTRPNMSAMLWKYTHMPCRDCRHPGMHGGSWESIFQSHVLTRMNMHGNP